MLAALDVEATCLDARRCRLVALALIPFDEQSLHLDRLVYAVNRGVRASDSALIHGVAGETQPVKPTHDIRDALVEASRYTLVTYGRHDAEFIVSEARRLGINTRYCFIDVLETLLKLERYRSYAESRGRLTLSDALEIVLGVKPDNVAIHDPISDAMHVALLYMHLVKRGIRARVICKQTTRAGFISRIASLIVRWLGGY